MQEAFGIFFVNTPQLIFSLAIMALGGWLFQGAAQNNIRSLGGAFLATVGGLALLNSAYFDGFKWINNLAGVILVIFIGYALVRNTPGNATTAVGVIVVILGILSLSDTRPFQDVSFKGGPVVAFNNGFSDLMGIFGVNDWPGSNEKKQKKQNSGHKQQKAQHQGSNS